ncbi:M23 family metallopeptidase [Streptomyces sp. XM83C]|uniref:M23 family metallopeptidase n=1 Tax=unclassified Streptomyces TaxID=2593676 RepID=UPI001FF86E29|nr:M23 family metallopeptidase [Streptomyces sp. XM83C]MCK1818782.1 M23 family metallopeptidase [Streptomyces sp. XM83C]
MNDRHPSGTATTPAPASDAASAPYAAYGPQEAAYGDFATYNGYDTTGYSMGGHTAPGFDADPLFGSMPADTTGAYDSGQWATVGHAAFLQDPYAAQQYAAQDTGAYDTTSWTADQQLSATVPAQGGAPDISGQWDASAWLRPDQTTAAQTQQWEWGTQAFDTGAYDATQWNTDGTTEQPYQQDSGHSYQQDDGRPHGQESRQPYRPESFDQQATATFDALPDETPMGGFEDSGYGDDTAGGTASELSATGELPAVEAEGPLLLDDQEEVAPRPAPRTAGRGSRGRRRTPAKRSALLTVAVPSVCVMGVAGVAAASVGTFSGDDSSDTATTASDAQAVKPSAANKKLDTELRSLSAAADDFTDRASRTQERLDLKAQQELERKKAAEEAARKERLRPKFALPVAQHGLSAYYGQAGINWMSVHTGIDFPVAYGSTVMAATDGTVRTQWNNAYGNMMIVTAKDGTETWYCHLSSYRVASGTTVKAGEPIAYSGSSGNSTGPHLHFEVRPYGGSAIDPLSWLRSHGLDPT